jgi:hypothetical protein
MKTHTDPSKTTLTRKHPRHKKQPDAPYGLCEWCGLPKVEIESTDAWFPEPQKTRVCLKCFNNGRREHGWE